MFALLFSLFQLIIGFLENVYHSLVPDLNQHFEMKRSNNNSLAYHPYPHLVTLDTNFKSLQKHVAVDAQSQITSTDNDSLKIQSSTRDVSSSTLACSDNSHSSKQEDQPSTIQKLPLQTKTLPSFQSNLSNNPRRRYPFFLHMQSASNSSRKRLSSASLLCRNMNWNGGNFKE
ncbi:predicted protein [Naegleria gruberi]|uniref:Predicted protein n=1 Tax=Naegleria gruberi TaxID=5762 RepID=D2V1M2_NAEGR|nr:uncharacterized protein NAEGRDRAFT_62626 [Naegleria gruberi]EFC49336.1 predicted protein [Naegleria gruberi]|eukprot:XP_002682080.1 predicted protein [Naegleria gruberi strain NEG-M]